MAAILPVQVTVFTDKMTAWYLAVNAGLGNGASGVSDKATGLQLLVFDLDDYEQEIALLQPSEQVRLASLASVYVAGTMSPFLSALSSLCAKAGIPGVHDLDTYATHYNLNATAKWQCLFPPDFRALYGLCRNGNYPSAHNVYFEVQQGAAYPNALRKLVVGTGQTAGHDIDQQQYAGGFPYLRWSGVSGTGTVQVTGLWRKTDGTTSTGTSTVNVSTASGTASISPPFANALILTCTDISVSGISAGTLYAEAWRPSGRSNPPT